MSGAPLPLEKRRGSCKGHALLNRRDALEALAYALSTCAVAPGARGAPTGAAASTNVEAYGASVERSAAVNRAAFAEAIAATPTGGTLLVPARGTRTYRIDTSGGLSAALRLDRPMTVSLQGQLRATHGGSQPNPPYLFHVTGDDVAFSGGGMISGPGLSDDSNLQDDTQHAGLIRVTGNRFRFVGPTVTDVPKVGILLWACRNAVIGARWRGGIKTYVRGNTGLFGIRATGGGGHRIMANRFERDGDGRRLITGYFAGGLIGATSGDEITGNFADVHEKLAYLHTNGSRVADCHVVDALQTDIVRIVGSRNLVEQVTGERIQGGVSIYNGAGNVVRNCDFSDVRQQGVFVGAMGDYRGGFADTIVAGNRIRSSTSRALQDGITLTMTGNKTNGIVVAENDIAATGPGAWTNGIRIEALPPHFVDDVIVEGNIVAGAVNGLALRRLNGGAVGRNTVSGLRGGQALLTITS